MLHFSTACGIVLLLISGCGGASADKVQLLRSEVFTLKQEQRELQHEITVLDSLLRKRMGDLNQFDSGFLADFRKMQERISIVEQRLVDMESLVLRLKSSVAGQKVSVSGGKPEGKGSQPQKIDPRDIFDLAYKDYTSANYEMAVEGFRDFLARFPESPLAPEVHLYIGNAYRAMKKYDEAMSSYRTIVDKFPESPLHPDALFRIGDCLIKLGDRSRGETYFQTVIQRFPDSNAAALARAKSNL